VVSQGGRPAVFVAAHLANVVLTVLAGKRVGRSGSVIFQPDSNPAVQRMIERRRSETGIDLVPSEGSMRALVRELASGRSVGLVVDHRYDIGEMVPFFGVETPTLVTPARLALRRLRTHPGTRACGDGARFRITFHEPVTPRIRPEPIEQSSIDPPGERAVRAVDPGASGQWITVKRRWLRRRIGRPAGRVAAVRRRGVPRRA
jgi:KDO2-lipid IV(A) lauroyltransferase